MGYNLSVTNNMGDPYCGTTHEAVWEHRRFRLISYAAQQSEQNFKTFLDSQGDEEQYLIVCNHPLPHGTFYAYTGSLFPCASHMAVTALGLMQAGRVLAITKRIRSEYGVESSIIRYRFGQGKERIVALLTDPLAHSLKNIEGFATTLEEYVIPVRHIVLQEMSAVGAWEDIAKPVPVTGTDELSYLTKVLPNVLEDSAERRELISALLSRVSKDYEGYLRQPPLTS